MFDATFNSITVVSQLAVLLIEEIVLPGEKHLHVASHQQTISVYILAPTKN